MRIGMMVDNYKPYVSGITNYVEINKKFLEQAGHQVYVFTFGEQENNDKIEKIVRSPGVPLADTGMYFSMRYSPAAKKLVQTMDIVHVHHPFLSGRLALRYCRPLHIPIVFTNHTRYDLYAQTYLPMMPEEISQGFLQTYMPSFCNAVDMVISPSQGMAKVLRELNVDSHVEVVPNGVDLAPFQQVSPLPRASFGYKEDDLLLVYSGRIAPEKNLPFLLKSFAGVAEAIPNVYLLMVGSGSQPFEEELRELTEELKIAHRIRFTGRISYEQLPAYLAMCDIFVTASVTEVHPLSVIEAMGAELPVMGVESVGVGDTVQDGVTGFLSTNDLPGFTAKLTRLCLDPNLRRQMSDSARESSTAYAIERTTAVMLGHYQRLVKDAQPRKSSWRTRFRSFIERFNS
jgi:1,2-diacylglycerol 3-alpha-glucosyltransferase